MCVRVCVCFQIKTRHVFRQLLQILPRVTGKKAIFVPHLFQTSILQMTIQICGLSYYCTTQLNRFSASWLRGEDGIFGTHQWENQGVEAAKLASGSICLVGQLHAGARVLVLMQHRKEEEFVFIAIYRQEWCLWHSSCSPESGDTLTFSQLSWPPALTWAHTLKKHTCMQNTHMEDGGRG